MDEDGTGPDAETRLVSAKENQDDFEAQRMRSSVAGALFDRPTVPIKVDRYVVLEQLGSGGAGIVYSAYDPELDRRIALKLLRPEGGLGGSTSPDAQARLRREAQAMAQIAHPNVITVYDVGEVGEDVYIAMELIEGEDLAAWMRSGPHPWREALARFLAAGEGLDAAHRNELIHRDFKPGNVLCGDDGRVCVVDFGLAKYGPLEVRVRESTTENDRPSQALLADDTLTITGAVLGTPAYMAPEQYVGHDVDTRADQYAFCLALYEAVYGVRPFGTDDASAIKARKLAGEVSPLNAEQSARAPAWLRRPLLRGLSVLPEERFASMRELLDELERDPDARRSRMLWAGGAVAAFGAVVVAGVVTQPADVNHCAEAGTEIRAAWNDDARSRVQTAFEASGANGRELAFGRADAWLSEYADAWAADDERLCEELQTTGPGVPALIEQRLCLDRRLREYAHLVEFLAGADAAVVTNAGRTVRALPSVASCADNRAAPEVPEVTRELASELDIALTGVDTLRAAGKVDEAFEAATSVRERAKAAGLPAREARALVRAGRLLDDRGELDDSLTTLMEGLSLSEKAGDDATTIETLLELTYVRGVSQADYDEGVRWATLAAARIERDGNRDMESLLHNHRGVIASESGDPEACQEHLAKAIAMRELDPSAEIQLASSLNNMGTCVLRRDDAKGALEYYRRAYEINARVHGPDHVDVASPLGNIATAQLHLEQWSEARTALETALKIFEGQFGRTHPRVAITLNNLGRTYKEAGDHEAALAHYLESAQIGRATMGEAHPLVGYAISNAAGAQAALGRLDEARASYDEALALLSNTMEPDDPRLLETLAARAEALGEDNSAESGD